MEPKKNLKKKGTLRYPGCRIRHKAKQCIITEVTLKSKECEFDTDENIRDSFVKDRIICGIQYNKLQENILGTY